MASPAPRPDLQETQTHAHLKASFSMDAQASRLSERFARIAEIEGFPEIARTFRELAESQAFQAQGHLDLLMRAGDPLSGLQVGETPQNLRAALAAHDGELLETLPDMVAAARAEGFQDVASWFETMRHVREAHRQRLRGLFAEEAR
jgi:rubrerythrin